MLIKKIGQILTCLGLFIFSLFPTPVDAKSYSIDAVDINAVLNEDGSMQVTETRQYNFDGSFSFAYLYINTDPDQSKDPGRTTRYSLSDFQLCEATNCYQLVDSFHAESNTTSGTFYVNQESDRYYIKWFYSAYSEIKTFTLSYTVNNAITSHVDVNELYWQFIGSDWEVPQNKIEIDLTWDFESSDPEFGQSLQAWAHGQTGGKVAIPSDKQVTFAIDQLDAGNFFEGRVLFPAQTFTSLVKGTLSKTEIIKQEQSFIKQSQIKARLGLGLLAMQTVCNLILLFLLVQTILRMFKHGVSKSLPQVNQPNSLWEPPSDLNPAQVAQLLNGNSFKPVVFTSLVLSLVQAKKAKILRSDQKEGLLFKKYQYSLQKVTDTAQLKAVQLDEIQQRVYDFIFQTIAQGQDIVGFK